MQHSKKHLGLSPVLLLCLMATPVLAADSRAEGSERAQPGATAQTVGQGGGEGVNPTRRLEAEIEDYPGTPEVARPELDTRIPEVVEEPPRPPTKTASGTAVTPSNIEASEVQRVFGREAELIDLATLDAAEVTLLQQRLRERGHYLGRIDGIAGPQTRAAVLAVVREQFTLSQRLLQQGQLTRDLAEQIGLGAVDVTNRPSP